jgi:hypothetical protein
VIEEIDEEEEEKNRQVFDVLDEESQEEKEGPATLEKKMEHAKLASGKENGACRASISSFVGKIGDRCLDGRKRDLNDLIESSENAALYMVS